MTKRIGISKSNTWLIRIVSILAALLIIGLMVNILKPGSFGYFFEGLINGNFKTQGRALKFLCSFSIYLLLSLSVVPAFKMRFWNIGAEGQALAGCLGTAMVLHFLPNTIPNAVVIIISLFAGLICGILWALIPTFFKLKFNTNETLFTLLMNYIITPIVLALINFVDKSGHGTFPAIDEGRLFTSIGGVDYLPVILCAIVITIFMYLYLKKTKQGFELSVLGDSANTARYTGISKKKVSYRTMILSGAIAGLVGFLLVCCVNGTLSSTLVGGRGFTAVLIAWLGHFEPLEIALFSGIVSFLEIGSTYAASLPTIKLDSTFLPGLVIGIFILVVVIAEFFIRYKLKWRLPNEVSEVKNSIVGASDIDINVDSLFKKYKDIGAFSSRVAFEHKKEQIKKVKNECDLEIKQLKSKYAHTNSGAEAEILHKKILDVHNKYILAKKQFKIDRKEVYLKHLQTRYLLRGNISRIKHLIVNKNANAILVVKSGTVSYPTKNQLKVFFNNIKYTNWPYKGSLSDINFEILKKKNDIILAKTNNKNDLAKLKKELKELKVKYKKEVKKFHKDRINANKLALKLKAMFDFKIRKFHKVSDKEINELEKSSYIASVYLSNHRIERIIKLKNIGFKLAIKYYNCKNLIKEKKKNKKQNKEVKK